MRGGQTLQPLSEGTCDKRKLYLVWFELSLCTRSVIPSAQQVLTGSCSHESDDLCLRMRRPKRTRLTCLQEETAEPHCNMNPDSNIKNTCLRRVLLRSVSICSYWLPVLTWITHRHCSKGNLGTPTLKRYFKTPYSKILSMPYTKEKPIEFQNVLQWVYYDGSEPIPAGYG